MGDIEHEGAGGVGHVDGAFSGKAEADVVFGQHDVGDAGSSCQVRFRVPRGVW